MKKEKQRSLKSRMIKNNVIMIIIIAILLLFYNLLNIGTSKQYNDALKQYSELNYFYDNMNNATTSMKEFLYNENMEAYKYYSEYIDNAKKNMQVLIDSEGMKDAWRFDLLNNMLDDYGIQSEKTKAIFLEKKGDYETAYNAFLHSSDLIKKTSATYYQLITSEMGIRNEELEKNQLHTFTLSIMLFVGLLIWIAWISHKSISSFTEPLYEILRNIKRIKKGEYDLTQISNTGEEMEELCFALEDMAISVKTNFCKTQENLELEKKLLEQENENLRKDDLLVQSELKMLQNQINPHFLFNTLNMIYKMADYEKASETSQMIECTAQLLRYGLDKQNKLSNIKSEAAAIENYITIQTRRLGDRVKFTMNLQQDIPNVQIPGMIIQPLIENSLKHGLQECIEGGEVTVRIYCDEEYLYISVSDNGKGMDSDDLEYMMLHNYQKQNKENHLGLYNVVKRLEAFFSDRVDISVNSSIACGFEFVIKIMKEGL